MYYVRTVQLSRYLNRHKSVHNPVSVFGQHDLHHSWALGISDYSSHNKIPNIYIYIYIYIKAFESFGQFVYENI